MTLCFVLPCMMMACGKRVQDNQVDAIGKSPSKLSDYNDSVACHFGDKDCPGYLAYIKSSQKNCNAVLVDDGILLTSSSCFENRDEKSLCESLEVIFPSTTDHDYQKLKCHKIIFAEPTGEIVSEIESDYSNAIRLSPASVAYIQISTTGRKPIEISVDFHLEQSLRLQAYSYDIAYEGELFLGEKECFVSLKTYASPLYGFNQKAPAALTNCLGKSDELGAPVLNSSGQLVAIHSGFFGMSEASGLMKRVQWDQAKEIRRTIMAQKIGCLDITNFELINECQNVLNQKQMNKRVQQLFFESLDTNRLVSLEENLEFESLIEWEQQAFDNLNWFDNGSFKLNYDPICKHEGLLPESIPSYKPSFKIKHGWRLELDYIQQLIPLKYSSLPDCQ